MKVSEQNWMQIENRILRDDRCVLPLGCTEQHAYLSLCTDSILAEKVAVDAAAPLGVPVFPVIPYGMTPSFLAFPGTVSLDPETYRLLLADVLGSLTSQGFSRILIVNGHGGNTPAKSATSEWALEKGIRLVWHDWWRGAQTGAVVREIDPQASHASWMENFAWTRLRGVAMPDTSKPMIPFTEIQDMDPAQVRGHIGDGSFGGYYHRSEEDMSQIWEAAVFETRELIEAL